MRSNRSGGIEPRIHDMGYILATPADTPIPSYYELGDGTILSVLARIDHILVKESGTGAVNHTMGIMAFVPRRHQSPPPMQPNMTPNIVD